MPEFKEECTSRYTVTQLYDMVLDIEKYPEFLPWCSDALIISKAEGEIVAELEIRYGAFAERYRSLVKHTNNGEAARIEVKMISGPFKHLENLWVFERTAGNSTKLSFDINFEVESFIMRKVINLFFYAACQMMVTAFEQRANVLYGAPDDE